MPKPGQHGEPDPRTYQYRWNAAARAVLFSDDGGRTWKSAATMAADERYVAEPFIVEALDRHVLATIDAR